MLTTQHTLLPSGFYDLLPPEAGFEALLLERAMQCFANYGYERVRPPLAEFEESLLAHSSGEVDRQTFRLMDPLSQKMMGVRADITMQIGRIAATRLKRSPRPLRLCYSGMTLHTFADPLNPTRQMTQTGAELFGPDNARADAESITLAVAGLEAMGLDGLSVDLTLPPLIPLLLKEAALSEEQQRALLAALAHKDTTPLDDLAPELAATLHGLVAAIGPAQEALQRLQALTGLSEEGRALIARLSEVVALVHNEMPHVALTVDATENRGFDYHTGLSFAFFARGIECEIGRGGRYLIHTQRSMPAIGFTLYITPLLGLLQPPPARPRLYVPAGTGQDALRRLQLEGYVTVRGLEDTSDNAAEAARLNCQAYWHSGTITRI